MISPLNFCNVSLCNFERLCVEIGVLVSFVFALITLAFIDAFEPCKSIKFTVPVNSSDVDGGRTWLT